MWQKLLLVSALGIALDCASLRAGTDADILFTLNGDPVSVGEFNGYCERSGAGEGEFSERLFNYFLYFKLKVADARRMKIDTLMDFRLQCRMLQGQALEHYVAQAEGKKDYSSLNGSKSHGNFPADDWVKIQHITLSLPQHSSAGDERKAEQRMDSVYHALKHGASFEFMASRYGQGEGFGYRPDEWLPLSALLDEFVGKLEQLKPGEFSDPFYSPLGVHIVRLIDRRHGMEAESAVPDRGLPEKKAQLPFAGSDLFRAWKDGTDNWPVAVSALLNRVEDELLAVYWDKMQGKTMPLEVSDEDLERYFKSHRKEYQWSLPHFRGGVVHCLDKKSASRLKKILKKIPYSQWNEKIRELAAEDERLEAVVETGVFRIGVNAYVDRLAFKCGSFVPFPDLPFTFVLGKRLKKGPESYLDVIDEVRKDYLYSCQDARLAELKNRYLVEINKEVLKTVNCGGSN